MKPFSEMPDQELTAALTAIRPEPTPVFAAELDERAAAGFPRRASERGANPFAALLARLRVSSPRRMLIPAGGIALAAIVAVTIVVAGSNTGGGSSPELSMTSAESFGGGGSEESASGGAARSNGFKKAEKAPALPQAGPSASAGGEVEAAEEAGAEALSEEAEVEAPSVQSAPENGAANGILRDSAGAAAKAPHRAVERNAEITIGTKPGEVGDASSQVFGIVHRFDGVVLNSSTTNGSGTDASASFELLIPSGRLGDAMAEFSKIGEVTSRHEATLDITAPTVGASERLQDSSARIDGLLTQLSEATVDSERETVEAELNSERAHAARLKAHLTDLKRRANLSRVSLRIESGKGALSPGGKKDSGWGIGDALHDAGHLLAVGAGVAIIALAVLAPLALILFLVWLAGRSWTRRARERALT